MERAGPVTYPSNEELRRAVASLPAELLLVETDILQSVQAFIDAIRSYPLKGDMA